MSSQNDGLDAVVEMAKAREQRNNLARERMGDLVDAADAFIWHIERWLTDCVNASSSSDIDVICIPEAAKAEALCSLACNALHSLQTLAENCRIGIHHPSGWLQRKLYETRTNALFIAFEPTGKAGQRWLHYGWRQYAKVRPDDKAAQDVSEACKQILQDADLEKEGRWAETVDERQRPKKYFKLLARADYVEKTRSTNIPAEIWALRAGIAEHATQMVRGDNMVVHPSVTGTETGPDQIMALYSAVQWTWDTAEAYSNYMPDAQRITSSVLEAHYHFWEVTMKTISSPIVRTSSSR